MAVWKIQQESGTTTLEADEMVPGTDRVTFRNSATVVAQVWTAPGMVIAREDVIG